jgi:hypothetical protein
MKYLNRGLIALLGGILVSFYSQTAHCSNIQAVPSGLADGPGVWLNMWNYPADPESYCLKLHASGIRNLFIQTSRSNTDSICNPSGLASLLETAHRYKMRVIAWSFAELKNPTQDAAKLIAAARFLSPKGDRVDAIAPNLEKDLSANKVQAYSQSLRDALGESYPMIAVVYSPLNHAPQVASIPWTMLDKYYNVIAPMNYWNSKYEKIEPYEYTLQTIKKIRALVGRSDVEIHVIGDGMGTHGDSIKLFLAACRTGAATSASLYPNQKITEEQLSSIAQYPDYFVVNSRFRLAAYRELVKRGSLVLPEKTDPADAIRRGEFFCLLLRQLYPAAGELPSDSADFGQTEAMTVLTKVGVLKNQPSDAADSYLAQSISAKEALDLVASTLEAKERLKEHPLGKAGSARQNRLLSNISRKAERLFVQPAFAEGLGGNAPLPLSYLDAAQIVVQASAGLK